jgi:hypothetical protein
MKYQKQGPKSENKECAVTGALPDCTRPAVRWLDSVEEGLKTVGDKIEKKVTGLD